MPSDKNRVGVLIGTEVKRNNCSRSWMELKKKNYVSNTKGFFFFLKAIPWAS